MIARVAIGEGRHRLESRVGPFDAVDGEAAGRGQGCIGHIEAAGASAGGAVGHVARGAAVAGVIYGHAESGVRERLGVGIGELHIEAAARVGHHRPLLPGVLVKVTWWPSPKLTTAV